MKLMEAIGVLAFAYIVIGGLLTAVSFYMFGGWSLLTWLTWPWHFKEFFVR